MGEMNLEEDGSPRGRVLRAARDLDDRPWPLVARLRWLARLEDHLTLMIDDIIDHLAKERGCSVHNALQSEYVPTLQLVQYYRKNAAKLLADQDVSRPLSLNFGNKRPVERRESLGIVGVISPFNFPFSLPMAPVTTALLAGNRVLLKPSPETPMATYLVKSAIESTLCMEGEKDRFSVLPSGKEFGEALVDCPLVDKVHFTGSVAAGRAVAVANAKVRFTPTTLELGGSNAAIVLADADIPEAVDEVAFGRFSGLACNGIKRVFVVRSRFGEFGRQMREVLDRLKPSDGVTKFSDREIENYNRFLKDLIARGHLSSGELATNSAGVRPVVCLMPEYDREALVFREETFCPILAIAAVDDENEAIQCTNDSDFGLGASIFTRDPVAFQRVAVQLDCGVVQRNSTLVEFAQPQVHFGGTKHSGNGYTHGPRGLLDFTRIKTVIDDALVPTTINKLVGTIAKRVLGFSTYKVHLYPWTKEKAHWLRKNIRMIIRLS